MYPLLDRGEAAGDLHELLWRWTTSQVVPDKSAFQNVVAR